MAKVETLFDYKKAELPDRLFEIKIRQSKIDEGLFDAASRFLTIQEQKGEIIKNDIVTVSIDCAKPWIANECERLRVGSRYSYPELEKELIGKKEGDVFTCPIDGEDATVKVLSVKRRIVPELTDQYVEQMELEDIHTVADYAEYVKEQLVAENREKKEGAICTLINRQLTENTTFKTDPAEVEEFYQEELATFMEEVSSEEELETVLFRLYHVKGVEAGKAEMRHQCERQLKLIAIADEVARLDGQSWGEKDYDEFIAMSASERMPEEELREAVPFADFLNQQKIDYLQQMEVAAFEDRFTVEVIDR